MRKALYSSILLLSVACYGQGGTTTQIRHGATLPSVCSPDNGDTFFKTTSPIGPHACTATNTWVHLSSGTITAYRTCHIPFGSDDASSDLTTAQIQPQHGLCYIDTAATLVEIKVKAAGGTPSVTLSKNHAGSQTALLSSSLATGSSGAVACSNTGGTTGLNGSTTCSATLQNTSLAAGDYIDATAGATSSGAKWFTVDATFAVTY